MDGSCILVTFMSTREAPSALLSRGGHSPRTWIGPLESDSVAVSDGAADLEPDVHEGPILEPALEAIGPDDASDDAGADDDEIDAAALAAAARLPIRTGKGGTVGH